MSSRILPCVILVFLTVTGGLYELPTLGVVVFQRSLAQNTSLQGDAIRFTDRAGGSANLTVWYQFAPAARCNDLTALFSGFVSGGRPPYNWSWNFGDGSPDGWGQNTSHVFPEYGAYQVRLTVRDSLDDNGTEIGSESVGLCAGPPGPGGEGEEAIGTLTVIGAVSVAAVLLSVIILNRRRLPR